MYIIDQLKLNSKGQMDWKTLIVIIIVLILLYLVLRQG